MEKYSKIMIFGFFLLFVIVIEGCSAVVEGHYVEIKFSDFTGTNEKELTLNNYDNQLNMSGTVELGAGTVYLAILAKGSGVELYSLAITPEDSGKIHIDIDLNGQRNLIFTLTGVDAKDFVITLNSEQKLVLDEATPEKPAKNR